jgi:hypothetical protein
MVREFIMNVGVLCMCLLCSGVCAGMSTVIQQLVEPTGYNSDDAGLFGALIIGTSHLPHIAYLKSLYLI